MAIKEIKVSLLFEKHYKKLPNRIKDKAKEKEDEVLFLDIGQHDIYK